MTELVALDPRDPDAPLHGIRVLEIAGELTGYAGRLLAELGAEVVLADLSSATPDPHTFDPCEFFLHRGKSRVQIGSNTAELTRLMLDADVILQTGGASEPVRPELDPAVVRERNPSVVHAILTPFGLSGPMAHAPSTDLIRLAAGGLLWLGGYPDAEPVAAFGEQSTTATGIYGAVAVLVALLARERIGDGDTVEISSQEVLTQALETSIAEFEMLGKVRRRLGDMPREAGTGIFPCADGYVSMVAGRLGTAAAWRRLVEWLQETGIQGAERLSEPEWETLEYRQRPQAIADFCEMFGHFAAGRRKDGLYREGQRRSIAIAPVNTVADVLADPQLAARGFFLAETDPATGTSVRIPGPPFRFSPLSAPRPGRSAENGSAGVRSSSSGIRGTMAKPLEGIRVLDFCWVGAGALVTKLLAEQGADVIKVESRARPDNLRVAPPFRPGSTGLDGSGYFASRNNDKRSLALDMRQPISRELAREIAGKCDLVTNNFRPGVMEGWGLDYETLRSDNPSLVYLSMPMNGSSGPDQSAIGFGSTIAAQAGLVNLSGRPDRAPVGTGTHYPDHIPSPGHGLVAVLAALLQRDKSGAGRMIEISQLESTVNTIGPAVVAASLGESPSRSGNRVGGQVPSGAFRCAGEDRWIALAARTDEEWQALAATLSPELARDPCFLTVDQRAAAENQLERRIAELTRERDRDGLASELQACGVPAWPVETSEDILLDRQLRAREFWRELQHPVIGSITMPAAPFKNRLGRTGPQRAAPLLGEHTRETVTSLLGLSDPDIDALVEDKVLW